MLGWPVSFARLQVAGNQAALNAHDAPLHINLDPDFYPALELLARIHFAAEQYEEAIPPPAAEAPGSRFHELHTCGSQPRRWDARKRR